MIWGLIRSHCLLEKKSWNKKKKKEKRKEKEKEKLIEIKVKAKENITWPTK